MVVDESTDTTFFTYKGDEVGMSPLRKRVMFQVLTNPGSGELLSDIVF